MWLLNALLMWLTVCGREWTTARNAGWMELSHSEGFICDNLCYSLPISMLLIAEFLVSIIRSEHYFFHIYRVQVHTITLQVILLFTLLLSITLSFWCLDFFIMILTTVYIIFSSDVLVLTVSPTQRVHLLLTEA